MSFGAECRHDLCGRVYGSNPWPSVSLCFAFTPVARTPLAGAIWAFVAFYLVVLGFAIVFGEQELRALVGALFAALGLTYLWVTLRAGK